MRQTCPVCGKAFWCDYPTQWAYKREKLYICSWGCIREYDRKEAEKVKGKVILTREQKEEALAINRSGGNQLAYLKELGCSNPTTSWKTIKSWAEREKKKSEETERPAAQIAADARQVQPDGAKGKAKRPGKAYKVTGIRTEEFGEFYYDRKYNSIDWRTEDGDEIGMSPQGWMNLMAELPDILQALGVEV